MIQLAYCQKITNIILLYYYFHNQVQVQDVLWS